MGPECSVMQQAVPGPVASVRLGRVIVRARTCSARPDSCQLLADDSCHYHHVGTTVKRGRALDWTHHGRRVLLDPGRANLRLDRGLLTTELVAVCVVMVTVGRLGAAL